MSYIEAAMRSQEQLSQATRLASAGSRAAQGPQVPKQPSNLRKGEPLPLLSGSSGRG